MDKLYSVKIEVEVSSTSQQEAELEGIQDIFEHIANGSIKADVSEINMNLDAIQLKCADMDYWIDELNELSILHSEGDAFLTELKYFKNAIRKLREGDRKALILIEYINLFTYNDEISNLTSSFLKRF